MSACIHPPTLAIPSAAAAVIKLDQNCELCASASLQFQREVDVCLGQLHHGQLHQQDEAGRGRRPRRQPLCAAGSN